MLDLYRTLSIFISFPSDVNEERLIAEEVIKEVNFRCQETLGIHMHTFSWPHLPANTPEDTIQQTINEQMEQCNAFLLLLHKRYGTIEPGQSISNTEREIECALKMKSKDPDMPFLSYFKELSINADPGDQEEKVRVLRDELTRRGIFHKTFKKKNEFRDMLVHDLYQTVLRLHVSFRKRIILSHFWQLGVPEGSSNAPFVAIYPPVDRKFMPQQDPDEWWYDRLVPYMVFEDFKALQKIEKTLRIVGYRDCQFRSVTNLPDDIQDINRLWLCLPRSIKAQKQLLLYSERARFSFATTAINNFNSRSIQWGTNKESAISVLSPLSQYLKLQRGEMPGGPWKLAHGKIIAKDYAILARFTDNREDRKSMVHGTLKDYFLAGIRGLGTWGGGWFLDRCYHALEVPCKEPDADIQLLLEVTYLNESIHSVNDVSNKPQEYFQNENDPVTIHRHIEENV